MKNVTKTVILHINLTAEQWQLFTGSMTCTNAVRALNSKFNQQSKRGATRSEFIAAMDVVMNKYASYGASDAEPRWILDSLLNEIFA